MAGAPGAPRSHGFFQRFQKRHFWRAMPGGIHRGVPTALGSFFQKKNLTQIQLKSNSNLTFVYFCCCDFRHIFDIWQHFLDREIPTKLG